MHMKCSKILRRVELYSPQEPITEHSDPVVQPQEQSNITCEKDNEVNPHESNQLPEHHQL